MRLWLMLCRLLQAGKSSYRIELHESEGFCPVFVRRKRHSKTIRSFVVWRRNSCARELVQLACKNVIEAVWPESSTRSLESPAALPPSSRITPCPAFHRPSPNVFHSTA